jgi:predicted enzyme related to lactoylglutathione lyase
MGAPVLQWQLVTPNPDQAVKFYKDLFGWTVNAKNALGYRQIDTGCGISGGVWPAPPDAHSFVQLFIGVADVEQSVARATALGAQIVVPVTAMPDGDTMAVLRDPCGVTFGLMRR